MMANVQINYINNTIDFKIRIYRNVSCPLRASYKIMSDCYISFLN